MKKKLMLPCELIDLPLDLREVTGKVVPLSLLEKISDNTHEDIPAGFSRTILRCLQNEKQKEK
jgi:hypothetical protein